MSKFDNKNWEQEEFEEFLDKLPEGSVYNNALFSILRSLSNRIAELEKKDFAEYGHEHFNAATDRF